MVFDSVDTARKY